LDYQAEVAEWIGADSINLHGGAAYGDKTTALRALHANIERLPAPVRSRLTLSALFQRIHRSSRPIGRGIASCVVNRVKYVLFVLSRIDRLIQCH
jgi:hypothetical protein